MKVSDALDKNFVYAGDLDGRDVTLTIDRVADPGTVDRESGDKIDKPVVYFKETKRALVLGTTNSRRIQLAHGNEMSRWPGKKVTLYPTTTDIPKSKAEQYGCAILAVKGKMASVPCIRVRLDKALTEAPEVVG